MRGTATTGVRGVINYTLALLTPMFVICVVFLALETFAQPRMTDLDAARELFAAGKNGEAEAALVECLKDRRYSGRRAEAQVLLGRCLERRGDFAGAGKSYGDVVRDDAARRREPDAVREAFDRLHSLMVARRDPATVRRRLLDNAVRRIPRTDALSRICEREGDARLASGDIRGAMEAYGAAPSLSNAGADAAALLKDVLRGSCRIQPGGRNGGA